MASLLTSAQKASIQSALADLHDTFSRDIYVYVETKIANKPSSSSYNPLYGKAKDTANVAGQTKLTKHTFKARIFFENNQPESIVDANAQLNLKSSEGRVRIKVSSDAYEKIKICSRIEIDDNLYIVDSDAKNIGPFSTQYYMVYLKREN